MQNRQIIINAIMSVTQIVVISAVLFILYRFLLATIGIEQLGIWSLVLAATSVTQIANLGLSGSVVKFVAKYVARGEDENISRIIQTAALSVAAFVGLVLLIGYPVAKGVLGLVIADESLPIALSVLPYALLALWLMIVTSIFQAGLDGYLASLSKNRQAQIRRSLRLYEEQGSLSLCQAENIHQALDFFDGLRILHTERMQSKYERGAFANLQRVRFFKSLILTRESTFYGTMLISFTSAASR